MTAQTGTSTASEQDAPSPGETSPGSDPSPDDLDYYLLARSEVLHLADLYAFRRALQLIHSIIPCDECPETMFADVWNSLTNELDLENRDQVFEAVLRLAASMVDELCGDQHGEPPPSCQARLDVLQRYAGVFLLDLHAAPATPRRITADSGEAAGVPAR